MIKKSLVVLSLVLVIAGCSSGQAQQEQSDGKVTVSGIIKNPIEQGEIILDRFELGQTVPVATVYANDQGEFKIDVALEEAGFYRLNIYGQQFETLILDKDDLKVEADGQGGKAIKVTGSEDMQNMASLNEYMAGYANVVREFNQRYSQARQSGDQQMVNDLTDEGMALEAQKFRKLKDMAMGFKGSLVSLMITDFFNDKTEHYYFLDSLAKKLTKEIPNSSHVELFAGNLDYFRPAVGMGEVAPEITLPTPDGGSMSLSDLRGKYVLLDFWAGWCGPCRRENPNVVAMYNKYNDKGFEVFSVSLDRTRDRWVNAIDKDGLIWPGHVSDLKYFQSAAAIKYKVNAIPFALLLDPEGKVIGKNLRGRYLQAKLASIFGE